MYIASVLQDPSLDELGSAGSGVSEGSQDEEIIQVGNSLNEADFQVACRRAL